MQFKSKENMKGSGNNFHTTQKPRQTSIQLDSNGWVTDWLNKQKSMRKKRTQRMGDEIDFKSLLSADLLKFTPQLPTKTLHYSHRPQFL